MPALLIEDGYTMRGVVPAMPGRTPKVEFVYRPALAEAVHEYNLAPRQTGKQAANAIVSLLAKHLATWDAADARGVPIPVSAETLCRVPNAVLMQMVDIVTGYAPAQEEADLGNSAGR